MQSNKDKGKPQSGDPKGTDGAGDEVSVGRVAPRRSSLTPGVQDGVTRGGTCEMAAAVVVDNSQADTKFADNTDNQESNAGQEPNAGADSIRTDRVENQESAVSTDLIENQENAEARQVNARANDKVNIENQESNAGLNAVAMGNLNAVQTDNAEQENAASNAGQPGDSNASTGGEKFTDTKSMLDSSTSTAQENVVDTKSMLSSNAVQESNINTDSMQQLNAEQENNAKLMLEQNANAASEAVQVNAPVR